MSTNSRHPQAWIDLASPSHPPFFQGLMEGLNGVSTMVTAREKTETVALAREQGFDFRVIGRDFDNEYARILGVPLRTLQLSMDTPRCDVSMSARNAMCVLASKVNGVPSIHFTDNDITAYVDAPAVEDWFNRFRAMATHHVVPAAFETRELTEWGADREAIHTYDGYKEEVSIAGFDPDPSFPDRFPFNDYIVIRPEAETAAYVDIEDSLVPGLIERGIDRGLNVVYLPRRPQDESHAARYPSDRVYVPPEPVDGLQLSWNARCVLTGSGTMAREAACMRKPAVSFFPHQLLSVDQALVEDGRVLHSRDPDEIIEYISALDSTAVEPDLASARETRDEVVDIVSGLVG